MAVGQCGKFATVATMGWVLLIINGIASGIQLSIGIEHDMTKPTFGLHGQSSSQITYGDKSGLHLKGNAQDIFGPPLKIANGVHTLLTGGNMAGVGSSLKQGGALLGFDAKLLEAAGGANLLKGGLLMNGAHTKGAANTLSKTPGKQIGSIIELPVKVVALKDIAQAKILLQQGKAKEAEALIAKAKGSTLMRDGNAMKQSGMSQIMEGASEGFNNVGSFVAQTSGNVATLFKLLPLMLDLPFGPGMQQQQQVVAPPPLETKGAPAHQQQMQSRQSAGGSGFTGGSPFGGLNSLLPGMPSTGSSSLTSGNGGAGSSFLGSGSNSHLLFGQPNSSSGYAAVLNATNPLTNLLMSAGNTLTPFIMPLAQGALGQGALGQGPLGQALADKTPAAGSPVAQFLGALAPHNNGLTSGSSLSSGSQHHQQQQQQQHTSHFNLLPGLKVSETITHSDHTNHHSSQSHSGAQASKN